MRYNHWRYLLEPNVSSRTRVTKRFATSLCAPYPLPCVIPRDKPCPILHVTDEHCSVLSHCYCVAVATLRTQAVHEILTEPNADGELTKKAVRRKLEVLVFIYF